MSSVLVYCDAFFFIDAVVAFIPESMACFAQTEIAPEV